MIPPASGQDRRDHSNDEEPDDERTDDEMYSAQFGPRPTSSDSSRNVLMRSLFFGLIVGGVIAGVTSLIKSAIEYEIMNREFGMFSPRNNTFSQLLILRFIEHWIYFTLALFLGSVVLGAAESVAGRLHKSARRNARMLKRAIAGKSKKRRKKSRSPIHGEKSAREIVEPLLRDLNADDNL